ncbi:hypothetical protein O176_00675 [Chlamydia trachomatis]|nr:hypothetical protein E150_00660 [Chlamydia trachomatis E/150]ADH20584.1 hypothetical protein E11023_00650 [Chlamydia trachomatis E/11023]AGJ64480.1 hypothetical protein CTLINITIAL_02000 [Chlamydia trachomatis L2/434/Bu(i)]AGJ65420.1 hypothetical protein CTLFINAL_02000 [Chlamydia trachomatis L2/434/Bu(f)]AGR93542.1 hypothetical protein CTRC69_00655 [Chlamydia trachomatis RC-F/69]AGR94464.1 hypothetical protein CTRC46_00655 [Chlamydia trachomatis RC-L2(s)/46]AGR95386.1 hypothetical protein C
MPSKEFRKEKISKRSLFFLPSKTALHFYTSFEKIF